MKDWLLELLWTISPYHRIKEWWRLRLFREYQKGWIDASKDPQADLKIPMPFTYSVGAGDVATTLDFITVVTRRMKRDLGGK